MKLHWLVCVGVVLAGQAAIAAPTEGSTRPAAPSLATVQEVTAALRRFNADESRLFGAQVETADPITLPAQDLVEHWRQLGTLRSALERLERRGLLKRLGEARLIPLRHELAVLLSSAVAVSNVSGDYVEERIEEAERIRKENLVAIALLVNRSLDFAVRSVLGISLEPNSELPPTEGKPSPG